MESKIMKARIHKKLCKKITEMLPRYYHEAWMDSEVMEESRSQGSRVSNQYRVGGELDYWGEGTDDRSVFYDFINHVDLFCYGYPEYPQGHRFEGMPDISSRSKMTGKLAIEHARRIALSK